jgi:GNAT superfamily N-acetyltransferase
MMSQCMSSQYIRYKVNVPVTAEAVIRLFISAGLNRPVDQPARIQRMLDNANLIVTAWDAEELVGIARSISDFAFCTYLSDLAVKKEYQRQGIGRMLVDLTRQEIGEESMLLLLSVKQAMAYYPEIGFEPATNAFVIPKKK